MNENRICYSSVNSKKWKVSTCLFFLLISRTRFHFRGEKNRFPVVKGINFLIIRSLIIHFYLFQFFSSLNELAAFYETPILLKNERWNSVWSGSQNSRIRLKSGLTESRIRTFVLREKPRIMFVINAQIMLINKGSIVNKWPQIDFHFPQAWKGVFQRLNSDLVLT